MPGFEGGGSFPTIAVSNAIYGDNVVVNSVEFSITQVGDGETIYYIGVSDSNDGTSITWEEVKNVEGPSAQSFTHAITASGKWLYWRVVGVSITITRLNIEVVS